MNRRLSNRQSLICAAFGALSLFFVIQAKAQNQCSGVFHYSGSLVVTADIAELARMKLEIDLGKAQGQGETFRIKTLAQEFPGKWKIVLAKNHLQEADLKNMIVSEIIKLQKPIAEKETIAIAREELRKQTRVRLSPVYEMKDTVNLSLVPGVENALDGLKFNKILGYSQSKNIVVLGNKFHGIARIVELGTEKRATRLGGALSEMRSSTDGKTLLTLNDEREFVAYDIETLEVAQKVALDKKKFPSKAEGTYHIDLSPDKKSLAVADENGKVMIFDLEIGEMKASVKNDWISADKITAVRFIDNNRIVFDSPRALFRYDISTKGREILPIQQDGVMSMGISSDKSIVTLVQMRNAIAIDLKKFSIAHIEEVFFNNTNQQAFKEVPADATGHFVLIDKTGEKGPTIYDPHHMTESVFSFDHRYDEGKNRLVLDMFFSSEKDSLRVFYRDGDEYKMDTWTLVE